jgi:hypothetical protein
LDSHAFPSTLCLLISVSNNDLMDQVYIKIVTRLRDEMTSLLSLFPIPSEAYLSCHVKIYHTVVARGPWNRITLVSKAGGLG